MKMCTLINQFISTFCGDIYCFGDSILRTAKTRMRVSRLERCGCFAIVLEEIKYGNMKVGHFRFYLLAFKLKSKYCNDYVPL